MFKKKLKKAIPQNPPPQVFNQQNIRPSQPNLPSQKQQIQVKQFTPLPNNSPQYYPSNIPNKNTQNKNQKPSLNSNTQTIPPPPDPKLQNIRSKNNKPLVNSNNIHQNTRFNKIQNSQIQDNKPIIFNKITKPMSHNMQPIVKNDLNSHSNLQKEGNTKQNFDNIKLNLSKNYIQDKDVNMSTQNKIKIKHSEQEKNISVQGTNIKDYKIPILNKKKETKNNVVNSKFENSENRQKSQINKVGIKKEIIDQNMTKDIHKKDDKKVNISEIKRDTNQPYNKSENIEMTKSNKMETKKEENSLPLEKKKESKNGMNDEWLKALSYIKMGENEYKNLAKTLSKEIKSDDISIKESGKTRKSNSDIYDNKIEPLKATSDKTFIKNNKTGFDKKSVEIQTIDPQPISEKKIEIQDKKETNSDDFWKNWEEKMKIIKK